jgi:predicted SnoaL-like aldol condensation-catalyzing enzyme
VLLDLAASPATKGRGGNAKREEVYSPRMAVEQNKEIARRFIEEVWNAGRLEVIDELLSPNLVNHDWPPGQTSNRDQFRQFVAGYRSRYPNLHFTIEDMIAEGDEVATRVTVRGVDGEWTGIGIVRIADGQIVEQWADTTRIA